MLFIKRNLMSLIAMTSLVLGCLSLRRVRTELITVESVSHSCIHLAKAVCFKVKNSGGRGGWLWDPAE